MSRRNKRDDGGALGCAFMLMLAVVAMPLVGLYLLIKGEEKWQKILGGALLIVGIIVWIKCMLIAS